MIKNIVLTVLLLTLITFTLPAQQTPEYRFELSGGFSAEFINSTAPRTLADGNASDEDGDDSGRFNFLLNSFILSYGAYGPLMPFALKLSEPIDFGAAYLITSGAGFFAPLLLTMNTDISKAQASLSGTGGALGLLHGISVFNLIMPFTEFSWENYSSSLPLTMLAVSLSEYAGGFFAADMLDINEQKSLMIGSVAANGYTLAGLIYLLALPDFYTYNDTQTRFFHISLLAGSAGGVFAGSALEDITPYTPGDAILFANSLNTGLIIGISALQIYNSNNITQGTSMTQVFSGSALAGMAGAMAANHILAGVFDLSEFESGMVTLGGAGGALIGLGIGLLSESSASMGLALSGGYLIGQYGTLLLIGSPAGSTTKANSLSRLRININPAPLALGLTDSSGEFLETPVFELGYSY